MLKYLREKHRIVALKRCFDKSPGRQSLAKEAIVAVGGSGTDVWFQDAGPERRLLALNGIQLRERSLIKR